MTVEQVHSDVQEIRPSSTVDGDMLIEYDVAIEMPDGVVLRADVFRPSATGRYPVIMSMGPYAKGLTWEAGVYGLQWKALVEDHPDVLEGTSAKYQSWETVDPEKWLPWGYAVVRVDSRGAGRSAGYLDPFSAQETRDFHQCIDWAAGQPWSSGKVGLAGISYYAINEIGTNVAGLDLDDERFLPFFEAAQELDTLVLLHPHGFTDGQRLRPYYFVNTIGNPLDTSVALMRMIHAGLFDRFPRLKLCAVHGGGFVPFYSSRMDHSFAVRPEPGVRISRKPSDHLKHIYVDGLVFDDAHLGFLIQQMGIDHVVIGTDYPFDMGHYGLVEQVRALTGLTSEQRRQILSDTAARLLGLRD